METKSKSRKVLASGGIAALVASIAIGVSGSIPIGSAGEPRTAEAQAVSAKGGSKLPQGSEQVNLDPADFTTKIDNRYWPMAPGNRWVYAEGEPGGPKEKVVVEVTTKTKRIANGVLARVIRDTVTVNGVPVEVTDDWYAQDKKGNI